MSTPWDDYQQHLTGEALTGHPNPVGSGCTADRVADRLPGLGWTS